MMLPPFGRILATSEQPQVLEQELRLGLRRLLQLAQDFNVAQPEHVPAIMHKEPNEALVEFDSCAEI
jgi:hypothetical protein